MGLIYHIAYQHDWAEARSAGRYTVSTRGVSLSEQGFIHASTAGQVADTANQFYAGEHGLIVLVINERLLEAPVRYEQVGIGGDVFPHIYGPVNIDAVLDTRPLQPGVRGTFSFAP
jgi:glutathione S-transferase